MSARADSRGARFPFTILLSLAVLGVASMVVHSLKRDQRVTQKETERDLEREGLGDI